MISQDTSSTGIATNPNLVYIEQIGNTNTINIEQIGGTNSVGGVSGTYSISGTDNVTTMTPDAPSSMNYATINGSSNSLTITQHGSNNWAQYNVKGGNNQYTSTITGNSNKSKLILGDANTNNLRNIIAESITGNTNYIIQTLLGNDISSTATVTGSSNQITNNLKSTNGISDITITGSSNILIDEQVDSAGAIGHYLKQYISGDFNSFVIQQQGTNDTTVDIKTTGDHNTVTVRTSSDTIVNPQTAIAR